MIAHAVRTRLGPSFVALLLGLALMSTLALLPRATAAAGCGNTDADGDGLTCYQEYTQVGTDSYAYDTDGDGLGDGEEYLYYFTNPLAYDTDGDSVNDGLEVDYGSDPLVADAIPYPDAGVQQVLLESDGDGLLDIDELYVYGTDRFAYDTDGDGVDDGSEIRLGWNPLDPRSRPAPKG